MPVEKINDTQFKVVIHPDAPAPVEQTYDIVFLYNQKHKIIDDANSYISARQAELAKVQTLIDQAAVAGVFPPSMPPAIPETTEPVTQTEHTQNP